MQRYSFPANKATGQTVAIFATPGGPPKGPGLPAGTGYAPSDIDSYYAALPGFTAPTLVPVQNIDGTQNDPTDPDPEVTQDICIASTVAQDATIAVYFNRGDNNGRLAALQRATFPEAGGPHSVGAVV